MHEPWHARRVQARSAIQAEAILNRIGYECDRSKARVVVETPDTLTPAAPALLTCQHCGHDLDGLPTRAAVITCPECGHAQAVAIWSAKNRAAITPWRSVVNILAILGVFFLAIFLSMVLGAVL
ncbi:MAG: hypothetical protein DHS20C14_19010 [Phycisphaeraceae bacterium]|nr:MAG: hypothetical protein DHS20C14_19010 [Phycisphaeraceae bacterium]